MTVRNENDSVLVEIEPVSSNAINASFNEESSQILVVYSSGNVLVKSPDGNDIAEVAEANTADKAVAAIWQGSNVIITTASSQSLTKNSAEWSGE